MRGAGDVVKGEFILWVGGGSHEVTVVEGGAGGAQAR